MYGKIHSEKFKKHLSKCMKEKILQGTFTPNSNNRNTHWNSYYAGKKYRSSWEALYQYFDKDAEYETLRIKYTFNNEEHIYIVDFINHVTRHAIEVKPRELISDEKTQAKLCALQKWCDMNNYTFVLADKHFLLNKQKPTSLNEFDVHTQTKINKLYEIN